MYRGQSFSRVTEPYLRWFRLAWTVGEMTMAATQIMEHRTRRMALASTPASVKDQREFTMMHQEKSAAALEALQVLGIRMVTVNQQVGALVFKQGVAWAQAMMSIAATRTVSECFNQQAKLVRGFTGNSLIGGSKLASSAVTTTQRVLQPVRSRVRANVKRLKMLPKRRTIKGVYRELG